ncbi:metal-dependent hydrolase [Effusibacillus consociatus]|uniref:Metal-dependent hydrolase n=1 Tax=Effusibacillus consociatus TaxID=1117041 RepID=A0ABV9Q4R4_9BACL
MDTGSHLLLGVTLAGLAQIDPAVAQNPSLAHALMVSTVVGSHAPDFDGRGSRFSGIRSKNPCYLV